MPFFSRSKKSKALVADDTSAGARGTVQSKDDRKNDAQVAQSLTHAKIIRKPTLRYQPLDANKMELRLLQVQPGCGPQPLVCVIVYTALRNKPYHKYETISYCWGNSSSKTPIEVDGQIIDVYTTAADAIRRVRSPVYPRLIWIDQLCINQEDVL